MAASDDGEQLQQSGATKVAVGQRMSMGLWHMAACICKRHMSLKLGGTQPTDRLNVRASHRFVGGHLGRGIGHSMASSFGRLRAALSDEITWEVRVPHNKRVQDGKLKEKEAKRAQGGAQLRGLVDAELDCSLIYLCKPDPHGDSLECRCGVVGGCTGEQCVEVWEFSQKPLHQFGECKLDCLWHVAHVHGVEVYGTGPKAKKGGVHPPIGADGVTMGYTCTRCRGLKEICGRCHGEVLAGSKVRDAKWDAKRKQALRG